MQPVPPIRLSNHIDDHSPAAVSLADLVVHGGEREVNSEANWNDTSSLSNSLSNLEEGLLGYDHDMSMMGGLSHQKIPN
jgi:hypothetical protein